MDYKEYQNARDATWKILVDNNILVLPVPIIKICNNLHITVKYNERLTGNISSGQSTIIKDKAYIMIAPDCNPQRSRFTVAHELGHIILGHVGKYRLINREPDPSDNPIGQAANVFASRLLAPACVLWGCRISSAEEIAWICNISLTAARYRYMRYQILLKRNKFLTSSLEREVYQQFNNFILQHQASD